MIARHLLATAAVLVLLAAPASAQPAPARLATTSGLEETSSRSPLGFKPPTAETIGDYVNAVGAIEVNAQFHSTKETSSSLITVRNGADIALHASYSRKNGETTATLDGITLTANGVDGPLGTTFQRADIHADGSMTVKLGGWIPELRIDGIERQPDGEITLKGPWYTAPITITKDGDIVIGQKDSALGKRFGRLTIGHVDPRLFTNWPPRLDDIAKIAAHPDPDDPLLEELKKMGKVSAGSLTWDVNATADGLPIDVDGVDVKAQTKAHLHGDAVLGDGRVASVGSSNVVKVELELARQRIGDALAGADVKKADVTLEGAYAISVPLEDMQHLRVAVDGKVSYSVSADNVRFGLPDKGLVSIGHLDLDRTGGVHAEVNGPDVKLRLDDSRYAFAARGPIKIEKVGPISKLELDGELRSKGLAKISSSRLALDGDLTGTFEVVNGGTINKLSGKPGFYARTVKRGAKLEVKLDEVFAAVGLPHDGRPSAGLEGADVRGTVRVRGDLGDVTVNKPGLALATPDVNADVTATGRVKVRGSDVSGEGDVKAALRLPKGGSTTLAMGPTRASTSINPGAHVDVTAHVSRAATAAPAAHEEIAIARTDLNIRKGPGTSFDTDGRPVVKGTRLKVLERSGNWARVEAPDGRKGWVNTKYTNEPGSTSAGAPTIVNGRISGELGATNGTLDTGNAHADLKDSIRAKFSGPLKATVSPSGQVNTQGTRLQVPVRVDIRKGTKINYNGWAVTLTDDGNYAQFVGDIALDANGKPKAQRLSNVDVQLNLGGASLGWFHLPAFGSARFRGDVTFGPGGVKLHGDTGFKLGSWNIFDISF